MLDATTMNQRLARRALIEAEAVSMAIRALVDDLIASSNTDTQPLLEAIKACTIRLDVALEPVLDDVLDRAMPAPDQ